MLDQTGGPISGPKNWSSGYMPAAYQGVVLRADRHADPRPRPAAGHDAATQQRDLLDRLREKNEEHLAAAQRQHRTGRPHRQLRAGLQDAAARPGGGRFRQGDRRRRRSCTASTSTRTDDFGRKCLLARRLVERGVRFIQIYSGGAHNDDNWDAHTDLVKNHTKHAGDTDKPIAGLLKDLKQRGLLDSTLVVWGGEFGRQPTAEYAAGHRPRPQRLRLHDVAGRRRHQGRRQRRRDRRAGQRRRRRTASTSRTCTRRSCTRWASTRTS